MDINFKILQSKYFNDESELIFESELMKNDFIRVQDNCRIHTELCIDFMKNEK